MSEGFDLWEAYFTKRYGPDWRNTRQGKPLFDENGRCNCLYCQGKLDHKRDEVTKHWNDPEYHTLTARRK